MELIDVKILRFISRSEVVSNALLEKKYGLVYRPALDSLFEKRLIDCMRESRSDGHVTQVDLPAKNNWKITEKGAYFLANYKEEKKLTTKQQIINYFFGFFSGLLSGCLIQLFIRLLNSIL